MQALAANRNRIRSAWEGRVSGCILGKSVEVLSLQEGRDGLGDYLNDAGALPLRDYIRLLERTVVDRLAAAAGRGYLDGRTRGLFKVVGIDE